MTHNNALQCDQCRGWGHHKNSLEALQSILGGLKRAEVKHEAKTAEVSTADDGA